VDRAGANPDAAAARCRDDANRHDRKRATPSVADPLVERRARADANRRRDRTAGRGSRSNVVEGRKEIEIDSAEEAAAGEKEQEAAGFERFHGTRIAIARDFDDRVGKFWTCELATEKRLNAANSLRL